MNDPFDQKELERLFELNEQSYLRRNESSSLDFKETFNFANLEEYARDFAAFANNKGGYLIFGIKDSPKGVVGLKSNQFTRVDLEKITRNLNSIFSQTINIEKYEHTIGAEGVGLIYIHQCPDRPIIAKKNYGQIKEADIFYRYGARTERIRYPELKAIMDSMLEKERNAWMRVFAQTAQIGARNTAVLDTVEGTIEGDNKRVVVIDDNLIDQLTFIKEGSFNEHAGEPTLKLIGNLVPATVVRKGVKTIIADPYQLRASKVAEEVADKIGKKFRTQPEHIWAWKYYEIRPQRDDKNPNKTKKQYCEFKTAVNEYLYTYEWVDFLAKELSDDKKYQALIKSRGVKNP